MSSLPNNDAQFQQSTPDNNNKANDIASTKEVKYEYETLMNEEKNEENLKDEDIPAFCEEKKKAEEYVVSSKDNVVEGTNATSEISRDSLVLSNEQCGTDIIRTSRNNSCIGSPCVTKDNSIENREKLIDESQGENPKESDIKGVNEKEPSFDSNKVIIEDQLSQDLDKNIKGKQSEKKKEDLLRSTEEEEIRSQKIKEDKAKQPTAVMIANRPTRKKPRGKPRANTPRVASSSSTSARRRSISLATPKVANRKMTRRGSTGSYNRGTTGSYIKKKDKKSPNNKPIDEKSYLQSHSAEFRRRIKNVKSRLFKETKSFVAYKSARYKESQERRNRVEEIARRTQRLYADRSIDFSKKSKRQRDDIWRRRSTLEI